MLKLVWMLVALTAAGAPPDTRPAKIPAVIASADASSGPLWVSVQTVTARDGSLDLSQISGRARTTLESYLRPPVQFSANEPAELGCFGGIIGAPVRSAQTTEAHRAFYAGTITAIENGFYEGHPGAMLQVRVDSRVGRAAQPDETLLIFYPRTEFTVGGQAFCAGTRGYHTAAVGQRIALTLNRALPAHAPFIYPGHEELYFEGTDGALFTLRGRARELEDLTFADFIDRAVAREKK